VRRTPCRGLAGAESLGRRSAASVLRTLLDRAGRLPHLPWFPNIPGGGAARRRGAAPPLPSWLLLPALAGCAATLPEPETASLRVEGARIRIAAPEGLCVDPRSLDVRREGGFLILADCVLFQEAADRPVAFNGVLAVSISTGALPEDLDELAALLQGPGRAVLGRSGEADAISVLETRIEDDALFLKVRDAGAPVIPGAQRTGWRVFFPAGPRLVTAGITGFEGADIPDARALDLLRALIAATQAANSPPAAASPVAGAEISG